MTQITLSDFPESLQTLLTHAFQTGEPLTITQNNQPLAIISPIQKSQPSAKDSGKIIDNLGEHETYEYQSQTFKDLLNQVEPVSPDFDPDQAKAEYLAEKHNL
jgi:antitoxin (DNA-binding transcriptional repressor) of toxin-antitoxin stability system